jgi:hypothetical protein
MNFFRIDEQQTLRVVDLSHAVAFEFDLYIMRQRRLLFSYVELIESLRIDCSLIYLGGLSTTLIYSYRLISRTVAKCPSKLRYDLSKLRS